MMKRFALAFIACVLGAPLLPSTQASAAGNAHVVDDSEVETPGLCHVEAWTTLFLNGDGYITGAPACTTKKLPWLEIGAAYQHYWDQAIAAPLFGPAMKVNFQSETTGLGLGMGLNSGMNLKTGDLGIASVLALVTVPFDDKVKFHFNAGWAYLVTAPTPNAAFYGAQVEAKVGYDLVLMLEAFGRAPGPPGAQMGLRFTPNDGPIDFELMVGSLFDAANPRFITFGMTVRF